MKPRGIGVGVAATAKHNDCLFYDVDVFLSAHILEYLRPNGGTDLADVGLLEQQHKSAGLANASADAERDFVIDDCLVVRELQEIKLAGNLELLFERFGINADTH